MFVEVGLLEWANEVNLHVVTEPPSEDANESEPQVVLNESDGSEDEGEGEADEGEA